MKQKIVLLAFAILCGMNVLATNLVIERYAGAEMVQDIAVIGKWGCPKIFLVSFTIFISSFVYLLSRNTSI